MAISSQSELPSNITPILKSLMENATNNVGKDKRQRRHPEVLKKFATLLYINAGSMAYQFIQGNIPEALPSLRTVQEIVHSNYGHFCEGHFRFDELRVYLDKHKAPLIVTVSEDATRIISSVEYDAHTNSCVGFVLPNQQNGQLNCDAYKVTSFDDIEQYFSTCSTAKYAYIYTVQPLKDGLPSFCLVCCF